PSLGGALAFSPDGAYLFATAQGSIKRFRSSTGEEEPYGSPNVEKLLGLSPERTSLALRFEDGSLALYDVKRHEIAKKFSYGGKVLGFAFLPGGKYLAARDTQPLSEFVGDKKDDIEIFDPETGKVLQTLRGHLSRVDCAVFSPDASRLASGGGSNYSG